MAASKEVEDSRVREIDTGYVRERGTVHDRKIKNKRKRDES